MSEHAAALPLPSGADPTTADREASIEAARLASLGALVRGLAHEINNPLFGMLGLVELLQNEIEPGTKQHDRLALIQQSGLEIKRITHALQAFARLEAHADEVVPLQEVAAQAVELVTCASAGGGLEIGERYPVEPLLVQGSRARLAQVFLSLLVNASGVVDIRLERDDDWAVASITGRGTPLGLDAATEIVHMHGGALVSLPTVGGATYVLRLPLERT
jgi:two-component system NtrC family sensor kinase